jgi:hypothetical protein
MFVPLIGRAARKQRVKELLAAAEHHERGLRNAVAALVELSEEGDDLHVECRRLLERLED